MSMLAVTRSRQSSPKGFVRQIIQSDALEGIVKIPRNLQHQMVEIILLPVENETVETRDTPMSSSFLASFAGKWSGELLVREEVGALEGREEFL